LWDVDAHFASHAPLQVDLAPGLAPFHAVLSSDEIDAIDGADFQAGLAAGAIIGIDDSELFGQFLSWAGFSHPRYLLGFSLG
jgi:hypothetical protein